MSQMSFLEFAAEFSRASFLPMSQKEKDQYMKRIEDKVSFYQPKIESRTGVDLGRVYVLPNMTWQFQELYGIYCQISNSLLNKSSKKLKPEFLDKFAKSYLNLVASSVSIPIIGAFSVPFLVLGKMRDETIDLAAGGDCIRVPFGMNTRQKLSAEKRGVNLNLDEKVVHELSHILWNRIKIEDKTKSDELFNGREWEEGFSTYCHENYFSDFYPSEYVCDPMLVGGIYKTGKKKVEEAIQKHGSNILLEIPNRWRELEEVR